MQIQYWFTSVLLCTLLLSTGTLGAPVKNESAIISEAWQNPCGFTERTEMVTIELSEESVDPEPKNSSELFKEHSEIWKSALQEIVEMYPALQTKLVSNCDRAVSRPGAGAGGVFGVSSTLLQIKLCLPQCEH